MIDKLISIDRNNQETDINRPMNWQITEIK